MRTVSQLQSLLGTYVAPQGSFIAALNQVLERLYQSGNWKCLQGELTQDVSAGYICLPPDFTAIIAGRLNDVPIEVQGMGYEYQQTGPGLLVPPVSQIYGVVDKGWVSLMSDLPLDGLEELVFTLSIGAFASGDSITVDYTTDDGKVTYTNSPTSGTTFTLTPASTITSIESISYTSLPARVLVTAEDGSGNDIVYATLLRGDNTAQFRRYQIPQVPEDTTQEWVLECLCKYQFLPVVSTVDMVRLDNLAALKHGLLAIIAEDNADLDRAASHWKAAETSLSNDLSEARGGAKSYPQVWPFGKNVFTIPRY